MIMVKKLTVSELTKFNNYEDKDEDRLLYIVKNVSGLKINRKNLLNAILVLYFSNIDITLIEELKASQLLELSRLEKEQEIIDKYNEFID